MEAGAMAQNVLAQAASLGVAAELLPRWPAEAGGQPGGGTAAVIALRLDGAL
jgi:hypothetical protein